jgi:p-cumate 2,3-dioxygenase alpha subunit
MNKPLESGLGGTHFIRIDPQRCEFLVPRWAFTDPAVLDKEREEIFARCWLYVGHASEIPKAGDFVARKVGGRQLFLWRDEDGVPRVYFNTCTHRGAMVCREKQGNARRLTCPYHGWTFDTRGGMVEQPGASGFPDDFFANGAKDLISPAKVEAYRDFVFVNFDPNAVDLTTYLAGAAEYLDLVADQGGQGMEVTPG